LSTGLANGSHSVTVTGPPSSGLTLTPAASGSILIGGQVGYNWPIRGFVTGLEELLRAGFSFRLAAN
jgi:hypothetical protein